ncbi:hypothetical protein JOB18_034503 [Solea senegalensis]|uniref:Uncharacterized protein n=1 Tax=Solea senegalensis TaxID=28829 RepID=A0AAV6S9A6_SOLSE|nr:hypothetical protein JOB18_034503 [Solea senegalensis]
MSRLSFRATFTDKEEDRLVAKLAAADRQTERQCPARSCQTLRTYRAQSSLNEWNKCPALHANCTALSSGANGVVYKEVRRTRRRRRRRRSRDADQRRDLTAREASRAEGGGACQEQDHNKSDVTVHWSSSNLVKLIFICVF